MKYQIGKIIGEFIAILIWAAAIILSWMCLVGWTIFTLRLFGVDI